MFGALYRMPWYGHLLFAVVLAAFGVWMHSDLVRIEQEKAAALAQPAPEPVPLGDFRKETDIHLANEVHVAGWVNPEFNYHLTKERRLGETERYMFVLFDAAQGEDARMAHAAVLLTPAQKDRFAAWLIAQNPLSVANAAESEPVVLTIAGQADPTPTLDDMAEDAMAESGLTLAPDFIYVEPFLDGRAAALTPAPDMPLKLSAAVGAISALFLLVALVKLARRRARRHGTVPAAFVDPPPVTAAETEAVQAEEESVQPPVKRRRHWIRSPLIWFAAVFAGYALLSDRPAAFALTALLPALILALAIWVVYRGLRSAIRTAAVGRSKKPGESSGRSPVFAKRRHNSAAATAPRDQELSPLELGHCRIAAEDPRNVQSRDEPPAWQEPAPETEANQGVVAPATSDVGSAPEDADVRRKRPSPVRSRLPRLLRRRQEA